MKMSLVRLAVGGVAVGVAVVVLWGFPPLSAFAVLSVLLVFMVAPGAESKRVTAGREVDSSGKPKYYTLSYGEENVILEPGKVWVKVDAFKWVTRGLIEEPQSFHVLPNGSVDLNAEHILLNDPDGPAKLEAQINKHHPPSIAHKPPFIPFRESGAGEEEGAGAGKVHFRVKQDHLGHLIIECTRGTERVETGLRGLATLVVNGFMLKPEHLHVDPLQRSIEIDGTRFECNAEGAQQLQELLNNRYAPTLKTNEAGQIIVRENAASPTGFDIDFVTVHAGARLHIKGHLTQEKLNVLQDQQRCDLLHPGVLLRLSPPHLLVRRRRPDGGEESIPEVPDLHYLHVTAAQLQQILNHPRVRRCSEGTEPSAPVVVSGPVAGFKQIQVVHNPQSRLFLWLECVHSNGKTEGKAFTHHNVSELQHRGVFREDLDVSLSIDNHRLSVLNLKTRDEQVVTLDSASADADLARAAELLTTALKPQPDSGPQQTPGS